MQRISMIIFAALLICLCPSGEARTYIVDDSGFANYESIQSAVEAASDGDTIYIKPGKYSEEVVLNKSLTLLPLVGETDPIILEGDDRLETAVTINSDGCTLQGLTASNYLGPAIDARSKGNSIRENVIENSNPALLARGSGKNLISGNMISNSQGGIILWDNSSNNSIEDNQISGCNSSILIREAAGNKISGNKISGAHWGIWLDDAQFCEVENNEIQSEYFGMLLQNSSSIGINRNLVHIISSLSASTNGITIVNSSQIEVQENEIDGGSIGLGISACRDARFRDNTIAGCQNAAVIKDSFGGDLSNNSILGADYALRIENLSHSSVYQNRIERSTTGIELIGCKNDNITKNQLSAVTDTAMLITSSSDSSITSNAVSDCEKGIILLEAPGNRLSQNVFENVSWCLYVEASSREAYDNSIDESNIADSHPLVYLFNRSGEQIVDRDIAHMTLAYCDNLTVQNSTITRDALFLYSSRNSSIIGNNISSCYGMRLISSDGNRISGNQMKRNAFSGMFLYDSHFNDLAGNNASGNGQNGISLLSCSKNTIRDNVLDGNDASGIWLNLSDENQIYQNNISNSSIGLEVLESSGNSIFHNNFLDNSENSQDSRGTNSWDQGNVTGGNYWDDHVAKGNPSQSWPRMIKGGDGQDRYPFQDRGGWRLEGAASSLNMSAQLP